MSQKQNPYLPRFKDKSDSVAAEHRRPPPNRDPHGMLLAAEDGTLIAAKSNKASTANQAETVESPRNNDNVSAEAAATLMAFDVVALEATTTGNSNNDIVPNINYNNSNGPAVPSQSKHDHHQKRYPWNTAIVAVAVVVIVAVVVGGVVFGVCGSGGCGDAPAPAAAGSGNNPSPTLSPVEAGNGDNPSSPPTSTRAQDITNLINSKSYMGVDISPTGTSPEERALQWLIHDDPLQLNVVAESDEFRILQRYSLLTLWFQGDTGTTWIDSTNWLNADECTWFGNTCQSGVVTEVDFDPDSTFDGNGLQGSLSPDLGLLTDLTWFRVVDNNLAGSLPTQIGLWTKLERFSVWGNALTGSLPSEIGLWTNLNEFYVYNNTLKGSLPSEIGLWTNLEWFDFSDNSLTGSLPSEIGLWTNLEVFHVHENDLAGSLPSEIGLCTNLREFSVRGNELTGTIPATIANWKLIELAYFYDNNFSGSMPIGICEFITTGTDYLWADCEEVSCSCCTHCF